MTTRPPDPPPPFAAFFTNIARFSVAAPASMLVLRFFLPKDNPPRAPYDTRWYLLLTMAVCFGSAATGLWCAATMPKPVRTAGVLTMAFGGIFVSGAVFVLSAWLLSMR